MITLIAYGIKYDHPPDLHLRIGVTELHNPHRIPKLRDLTGYDEAVIKDVKAATNYEQCMTKWMERILAKLKEFPYSLHVGIHCLAGKHRSVVVVNDLATRLRNMGHEVRIQCR